MGDIKFRIFFNFLSFFLLFNNFIFRIFELVIFSILLFNSLTKIAERMI